MSKITLAFCILIPLFTTFGCGSSEPTVMTPDESFYESLEATPLNDEEGPRKTGN